ncbi:MAG: hypothetical protein DRI94_03885 [Bacteroidetes bacterium]|nr:MAG: hypothetical protein DRI94_03885 [Bacteroidota bacterium]
MKIKILKYGLFLFISVSGYFIFPSFILSQNTKQNIDNSDTLELIKILEFSEQNCKSNPDSALFYTNQIIYSVKDTLNKFYLQAEYLKGRILYYLKNRDSSIFYFNKIINHPNELNNPKKEVRAYNYIGLCYQDMGKYAKALKKFQQSIEKSKQYGLIYREAAALNNLSLIYDELGFYDKSLIALSKSLKLFQNLRDTLAVMKTYNNLGLLNQEMKDNTTAEEYFLKTLALANKTNNINTKASIYLNLGYLYTGMNKYTKALEYLKKALPLLKITGNKEKIAENYTFFGDVYFKLKQYKKSISYYNKAYQIYENKASLESEIYIINNLAKVNIADNNLSNAYSFLKQEQLLLKENSQKSLSEDYYKTFSLYYEKKYSYLKALRYYKKYSEIKDSLAQTKFNEKVAKQKILFENNLQQKKINTLNIRNKTGQVIQEHQSEKIRIIIWLIIAASIIILLGIFLTIFIFRQLRIKNKLYIAIKKNRKIVLEKNYEIIQQNEEIKSQTEQMYQINEDLMHLKTAVDETNNAVVILDKDGNFEWGNKGFDKLYDISFKEFKKKYPNIFEASKNSTNYVEMSRVIKNTIKNRTSGSYEFSALNKKGEKIWIKTNIKAITDLKGNIQSIIVVDTDITDRVQTGRLLEMKNYELEKQREEINSSLRYAKTIQNAILPTHGNMLSKNNFFLIYLPKDIVSGDFYWFSAKDDSPYIFYAVVDCTGHGVPGAFMSMIGARLLNYIVSEKNINLPSEILEQMNLSVKLALKQKLSGNKDGMDISLIRLEKTPDKKTKIIFSGAKQSLFIYSKRKNTVTKIRGDIKTIGGYFDDDIPFTNKKITSEKDDVIYLLSDGIIDQNSSEGKKIGTSGFQKILTEIAELPLQEQKEKITEILNSHKKETNQRDDITILGIKID